jgi:hypothetical protein
VAAADMAFFSYTGQYGNLPYMFNELFAIQLPG